MVVRDGQVHKVVRVVATSPLSWEDAARTGVAEGSKTIVDLHTAKITEADSLIRDGKVVLYRVKLEMAFQLDRSRLDSVLDEIVGVRRYLVIANQTLASPALHELVRERCTYGRAEFHVLVPKARRMMVGADPLTGVIADTLVEDQIRLDEQAYDDALDRLDDFRQAFAELGDSLSGEVGVGDPVAAARRVMERSSFDEIIVSTLPAGISRWLHLDLPARLQRAFSVPVISLVQD